MLSVGFMPEEDGVSTKPVGVHPHRSVLNAQVASSDPRMALDEEGTMHQFGTIGSFGKVYLGDVARAAKIGITHCRICLLYTSAAADE